MDKSSLAIVFAVLLMAWIKDAHGAMTEAQLQAAAKVMRNVCQPKTKVTNEQIDDMHKGVWNEAPEAKCYMGCVMQMMKMIKSGVVQYDAILKQLDTVPEVRREVSKAALTACKDVITNPEKCEAGYQVAKCMYMYSPKDYFLP